MNSTAVVPGRPHKKPRPPRSADRKLPDKGGKKVPFDLTAPLDGKRFKREMRAAERLQFRPLDRQLGREMSASNFRRQQELPSFYDKYRADVGVLQGRTQSAYDAALAKVAAFDAQGAAQDTANQAGIMDRLQRDAQLRGGTVDPSIDTGAAAAASARHNATGAIVGQLAGQGANQFANFSNRQAIGHLSQKEAQDREHARGLGIRADQRESAAKRGDFRTQFRADSRKSEREYKTELAAVRTEKELARMEERGKNQRAAADRAHESAQDRKDRLRRKREREDEQRHESEENKKKRRADKKKGGGGKL